MIQAERLCIRCGKPVTRFYDEYMVFERMHWLCFHLEFEHDGDPDELCHDPSCPWWHINVYKRKLQTLGHDPEKILNEAVKKKMGWIRYVSHPYSCGSQRVLDTLSLLVPVQGYFRT